MYLYSALFVVPGYLTLKALRHGSHSCTCNYTNACLYLVSFTRWHFPKLRLRTFNCSLLLIYIRRKDERLNRPGWLTYSGRFTHISGHPSAAGRAQDSESSPVKDKRSSLCHATHLTTAAQQGAGRSPPYTFYGNKLTTYRRRKRRR